MTFDDQDAKRRHARVDADDVEKPQRVYREPPGGAAARAEWFYRPRSDAKGTLKGIWAAAAAHRRRIEYDLRNANNGTAGTPPAGTPGGPGSVNWTPIGPSVVSGYIQVSGRVNAIVAGPSGNRVYAGAANGGVWGSTDGGATWTPLDDYDTASSFTTGADRADSLAVGALAVKFSGAGDDIFVGTGEASGGYDAYFGVGVRHFSGGAWSLEATNLADAGVYEMVIDPDDATPTNVFAATTRGLFRRPTSGSMTTWNQVTSSFASPTGSATSIVVAGSGASKWFYAAFQGDAVYRSNDGAAWTALTGLSGSGRIALGVAESDPTVLYALCADGTLNRLHGTSFSVVTGLPANVLFRGGQGWYDIAIAVDPTDPATIFLGGDRWAVFKGTIGGSPGSYTFPFDPAHTGSPGSDATWVGANVHSDVHTIAFGMNAAGTAHVATDVWVGSDGGVFRSTASGNAGTFAARNTGLAITEFSHLAQRADTDAVVFAGAQDNGTPRILGEQACIQSIGGDGGGVVYDPSSPYRVMRQYLRAALDVTNDGGATWSSVHFPPTTATTPDQTNAATAEGNHAGFVAPLAAASDGTSTVAAFGTNRLWVTPDWGTSWVTLPTNTNPYTPAIPNPTQDVLDQSVTAIAFASPARIFAATNLTVYRFDLSGTTWTRTAIDATGLPPHIFTGLAVENAAAGSFYVTLGGGGVAHAYYYDGSAWHVAMPTSVVDVPTQTVAVDPSNPSHVYVGTDVGCWKGVKSAGPSWTWSLFSQGLPEAAVIDVAVHDAARLLRASTHGRGVWEFDLSATSGSDPDVYMRANYNDTGRVAGARKPWIDNHLDPTHVGNVLYHYMSADIKVRRSALTGLPPLGSTVDYADFATNIGDFIDPAQHIETADRTGTDRIFVEIHNRSLTPVPASQIRVLLLAADAFAGPPPLPAGYAAHINGMDSSAWLAGTGWRFVDPTSPYRTPARDLDVRTPQVVEYSMDFSMLGLPSTHDHVCLAAFVTAATDQVTATSLSIDAATMSDKHVAQRNVHLVTVPPMGGTQPGSAGGGGQTAPQTVLLDVHNPFERELIADLVFDCTRFPGRLALTLPKNVAFVEPRTATADFVAVPSASHEASDDGLHRIVGSWLKRLGEEIERLGEHLEHGEDADESESDDRDRMHRRHVRRLAGTDRSQAFVAAGGASAPAFRGLRLPPGAKHTLSLTLEAPRDAVLGERYRLDVLQRRGDELLGGSTYIIAMTKR